MIETYVLLLWAERARRSRRVFLRDEESVGECLREKKRRQVPGRLRTEDDFDKVILSAAWRFVCGGGIFVHQFLTLNFAGDH